MTSRAFIRLLLVGPFLAACWEAPTAPEREVSLTLLGSDTRPFSATVAGNANLSPTADPCSFVNEETGSGEASHLGTFAWSDVEAVDFCAIPGGVAVSGAFVMRAANGDQLTGELGTTGTFAQTGDLVITGTYTITGGTGRFVGATGSGTVDVIATMAPDLPFSGSFQGTIGY